MLMIISIKLYNSSLSTLWRLNNWQKVLPDWNFVAKCSNIAKTIHQKTMNEQKLMKFCMLIPKSTGHCFCISLVAMTTSRADIYSCFCQTIFPPLQNMCTKKDMHKRKGKKPTTETLTERLETIIGVNIFFTRPLTSSKALKTSHTVFTNVTVSPYKHWCQHCSQTVWSHFSLKMMKFLPNRSTKTALC